MTKRRRAVVLWLATWLSTVGVAGAAGERTLGQFDAGSTLLLTPGAAFVVELERPTGAKQAWRWLVIDERVVRQAAPPTESRPASRPDVVIERHSFVAMAPGVANLCAELADRANPTHVVARYPLAVQVVTAPRAPAPPAP